MTHAAQPALLTEHRPVLTLYPYQRRAVDAVMSAWAGGIRRPALSAATGAGKTVMFSQVIEESGERTLVIAHRKEIIEQAAQKIGYIIDPADVGIVMADRNQPRHPVVVASIQTLANRRRLAQLGRFGLVVVDEAHHAASPSYVSTLRLLGVGQQGATRALGVSATWDRLDGRGFEKVFDEIVFTVGIEELIASGHLSDVRAIRIETHLDTTGLPSHDGDFNAEALSRRIVDSDYADTLAAAVATHAADRVSLVFAPNVRTAGLFAEALNAAGIAARMVSGETPRAEREATVADLRAGRLRAVVNCSVFTEGTDLPIVNCVVMGRPTRSRALYQQMAGRGLRTYPGKSDCLLIDLVGVAGRLQLQTAASLIGREDLPDRVASFREELKRPPAGGDGVEVKGELGKAFAQEAAPVELIDRTKLAWVQLEANAFSLPAGERGTLIMQAAPDDTYTLVRYGRTRGDREEIARGLDIGYAQGIAEQYVQQHEVAALADPNARWRKRKEPATPKQRNALRRWNIPHDDTITKREASDLLGAAIARANLRRGA